MRPVIVFQLEPTDEEPGRLKKDEVQMIFDFAFAIHDHMAQTRQRTIWWERVEPHKRPGVGM